MRDSRNTGIRSQTCLPRLRASIASRFPADVLVTMHPMHKSPSEVSPSLFSPALCPFAILTPARIRTVGGCHTVIYIHTFTAYIASHCDAFVYVRLGSRLGWRCPGRVQAGWYMHITTSRAGWLRRAGARCTGCRDLSRFSELALSPKRRSLLRWFIFGKKRGSSSRAMRCARRFLFRSFYE